jgi:hypothetical protein
MVVLTAAHCADITTPEDYTIFFGDGQPFDTHRLVQEVVYHPEYDYETSGDLDFDIAMLRLDQPAPDWAATIPPLPASLGLTPLDIGETLEYVGFGLDENGHDQTKLKVQLTIRTVCLNSGGCDEQIDGVNIPAFAHTVCHSQNNGAQGTASGDSGGPGFIIRQGQEYVAAITSYGDSEFRYYGCSTIVSAYETFISEFVGSFSVTGQACINSFECLSGHCRDGVCCESACDAPCMSCNHPRRPGECDVADDGYPCPDDDPCNADEYCIAGACTGSAPVDCTSEDACRAGSCQPEVGCIYLPVADGEPCDNGDQCDGQDECIAGDCLSKGIPKDCSDGDGCTIDSCDYELGCQHVDAADGTGCADADLCNGDEVCNGGVCAAETPLDCDDLNACTTDSCDPTAGCQHQELPDDEVCGECRRCTDGLCLPAGDCGDGGCGCSAAHRAPGSLLIGLLLGLMAACRRRVSYD